MVWYLEEGYLFYGSPHPLALVQNIGPFGPIFPFFTTLANCAKYIGPNGPENNVPPLSAINTTRKAWLTASMKEIVKLDYVGLAMSKLVKMGPVTAEI